MLTIKSLKKTQKLFKIDDLLEEKQECLIFFFLDYFMWCDL